MLKNPSLILKGANHVILPRLKEMKKKIFFEVFSSLLRVKGFVGSFFNTLKMIFHDFYFLT